MMRTGMMMAMGGINLWEIIQKGRRAF